MTYRITEQGAHMSTTSTQPGGSPVAGWYADPAGTGERWWDGARWTEHVRTATAPVAPTPPAAFVTSTTAHATPGPTPAYATPASAPAFVSPAAPPAFASPATPPAYVGYQPGVGAYGTGGFGAGGPAYGVGQPPWGVHGAAAYGPAPKNGTATAALALSIAMIVAAIATGYVYGSMLAVVLAARGLQAASAFEKQGHPPVGRARAAWALGISILMLVGVIGLKVLDATL